MAHRARTGKEICYHLGMQTDLYKSKLEEEKARLEVDMGKIGRRNLAVPGDWEPVPPEVGSEPDPIDQADITATRETNVAILADLEARYDTVLNALQRIERSTYGVCDVCGKKISVERLEADPTASTCTAHL